MTVKDIVDHARVAIERFSKKEIACRPPAKGPVKVRAVGEYIIRDGDGRDISDEVVVERAIKWSA
jgi:hypothetical protein